MKTKFKWESDILSTRRSLFSLILGLLKKITTILNCTFYFFFLILLHMYTYLNNMLLLLVFEFKKWLLPYKYSLLWLAFFTSHFVSRIDLFMPTCVIILCTSLPPYNFPLCHCYTTKLLIFLLMDVCIVSDIFYFLWWTVLLWKYFTPTPVCIYMPGPPGKYFSRIVQRVEMKGSRLCAFFSFWDNQIIFQSDCINFHW